MRTANALILVLALAVFPSFCGPASRASAESKPKAIRFGKLVVGSGKVLPNAVVVVDGDRIRSVVEAGSPIPPGAEVINLTRYSGIPGLIDVHTHMTNYWDGADGT